MGGLIIEQIQLRIQLCRRMMRDFYWFTAILVAILLIIGLIGGYGGAAGRWFQCISTVMIVLIFLGPGVVAAIGSSMIWNIFGMKHLYMPEDKEKKLNPLPPVALARIFTLSEGVIFAVGMGLMAVPVMDLPSYLVGAAAISCAGWLAGYGDQFHGPLLRATRTVGIMVFLYCLGYNGLLYYLPGRAGAATTAFRSFDAVGVSTNSSGMIIVVLAIAAVIGVLWFLRGFLQGIANTEFVKWVVIGVIAVLGYMLLATGAIGSSKSTPTPAPTAVSSEVDLSGPVTPVHAQKNSDGSYTAVISTKTVGWSQIIGLPDGDYETVSTGDFQWDPAVGEEGAHCGPNGASWTPAGLQNPDEFPLKESPICGLIGKVGDSITYLGGNGNISKGSEGVLLGINERWEASAFVDNDGDITVTFYPQ